MLKSLVKAAVNNPMVVNIIMFMIIGMGLFYTANTRRETFPNLQMDIINITVIYPGASSEEVEEGVTIKIEEAIEGVTGIDYVTSSSSEGVSSVLAYLKTDVKSANEVRDDIKSKVDQIFTFPDDAEEPSVVLLEHEQEVIALSIYGNVDAMTLKSLSDEIKDELLDIPEISKVQVKGVRNREMAVEISEEAMRRYGITFDEVVRAVQSYDLDVSGGTIKTDVEEMTLRAVGRSYRPEELGAVTLRANTDGVTVQLRDVAEVVEDFQDVNYELMYNGMPGVVLYVMKTNTEDTINIADAVKKYTAEKKKAMPPGVKLDLWNDSSEILNQRIQLLMKNGRYAIVLVFILLMIFLGWRLSFWVALGLPVAVMGTMILLQFYDVTINMMSLFAFIMVLGILVDDAIVVAENIQQYIERGDPPVKAAINGAADVFPAVFASVATTILAFMPLVFVQGLWGKFMFPIAAVTILGLVVSLFESLFILPAHLAHNLRPIEEMQTSNTFFARLRRKTDAAIQSLIHYTYKPVLRLVLRYNWVFVAMGFALFIFAIGVVASGKIKFIFFPPIDSEYMVVNYDLEPGRSMAVHDRTAASIQDATDKLNKEYMDKRKKLLKTPKGRALREDGADTQFVVRTVTVKGGGIERGVNPNQGSVFMEVLGGETRGFGSKEIMNRWRELMGEMPGVRKMDIEATVGPPGGDVVEVMLIGKDMDALRKAAGLVKEKLRDFNGVYEVQDSLEYGKRELRMTLNDKGKSVGLTLGSLALQVRQGFYGHEVHRIQRGRDELKVWVRYPKSERNSIADFESIRVRTPAGAEVPLIEVADITSDRQLLSINRYERKRQIVVSCKLDLDKLTPDELKQEVNKFMPDVLARVTDVKHKFEGQDRYQRQMMTSMMRGFQICLILIFVIIALTFRNYLHALMIMLLIPMGFVGAVAGHLIVPLINSRVDRMDLTMLSMGGIVALAGIVVNDSIVMIHAIKGNIGAGMAVRDSVYQGAVSRFRPIVLTTVTTSIGMMPLILEKSLQAQFLIPMAASIAFGLLVSTFFTQIWLPSIFLALNALKRFWYFLAKGRLYTPEEIERNGLPDGNFIKGLFPWWLTAGLMAGLAVGFVVFALIKK